MIKDLITRLMEEANEEAEHKGWCDTELSTNEQTRKEKTEAVETLHAEIDQLEASIAKLTSEIADLTNAVAELDAAMAKATKIRQDEKATNEETIKDSGEAQTAVAQALTVLKEFYAKAGDATALVQQQPTAPGIFDSPYKGMQAENGGVIGLREARGGHDRGRGDLAEGVRHLHDRVQGGQGREEQGHRAQDGEEAGRDPGPDHQRGGPRRHPERAGCRAGLLRQAQAVLRGRRRELRRPRRPPEGGSRVAAGGAADPQRRGHRLRERCAATALSHDSTSAPQ